MGVKVPAYLRVMNGGRTDSLFQRASYVRHDYEDGVTKILFIRAAALQKKPKPNWCKTHTVFSEVSDTLDTAWENGDDFLLVGLDSNNNRVWYSEKTENINDALPAMLQGRSNVQLVMLLDTGKPLHIQVGREKLKAIKDWKDLYRNPIFSFNPNETEYISARRSIGQSVIDAHQSPKPPI